MDIRPDTRIGALARELPATIRVFQQHGIDFCCGGKRPLEDACTEVGVSFEKLSRELAEAIAGSEGREERSWDEAPLGELVDHILERYHADLRRELPRLGAMARKVLAAHGERHPEVLPPLVETLLELGEELESHMLGEETILFPHVRRLEALRTSGTGASRGGFASARGPIDAMEHEHDSAAAAFARMRRLTGGYRPPENACNTFRGLYHGLAELEAATHRHIHLENNVLFPRTAELEEIVRTVA